MRLQVWLALGAGLTAGVALWAQQAGPIPPSTTGFGRMSNPSGVPPANAGAGFGRIIYPGTGGPPAAQRPGPAGARNGSPATPPPIAHGGHGRAVIIPYPVFYGSGYYDYDAPPPATPSTQYDPNQDASQPPVVIINQNFHPDVANPVFRDYTDVPLPPATPRQPAPSARENRPTPPPASTAQALDPGTQVLFLIALKDHTIYPAIAYWVEGDTLHYINPDGQRGRTSLSQVDREFSTRLNRERNIDFGLPN
jgi:hypothetical protein